MSKFYSVMLFVEIEEPVTLTELRRHIKEAIENWGGQYTPEHPLFAGVEVHKQRIVLVETGES